MRVSHIRVKFFMFFVICVFALGAVSFASDSSEISLLERACDRMLLKERQIQYAERLKSIEVACERRARQMACIGRWLARWTASFQMDMQKSIDDAQQAYKESVKEFTYMGELNMNPYPGKTVLDFFVAKAKVGWDDLFLKVHRLMVTGSSDEDLDVVQAVDAMLENFETQLVSLEFKEMFCARFQDTAMFKNMQKALSQLCMIPLHKESEALHALFGTSQFVLKSVEADTFAALPDSCWPGGSSDMCAAIGNKGLSEEGRFEQFCEKAHEYEASAQARHAIMSAIVSCAREREEGVAGLRAYSQMQKSLAYSGVFALQAARSIDHYMQPVWEMKPTCLVLLEARDEAVCRDNVLTQVHMKLEKDIGTLDDVRGSIDVSLSGHKFQ